MPTVLTGARILTPDDEIEGGSVIVEDGRIAEVAPGLSVPAGAEIVDLRGLTLVPGSIALHVPGGGGFSLATRDAEEARSYARWVVAHGVTSFVASIVGETPEDGETALWAIAEAGPAEGVAVVPAGGPPAGLSEGSFRIGGQGARLAEGRIALPDGTIAGSAATMDRVIRYAVEEGIATPAQAVRMASTVPAGVVGLGGRAGRGARGDGAGPGGGGLGPDGGGGGGGGR